MKRLILLACLALAGCGGNNPPPGPNPQPPPTPVDRIGVVGSWHGPLDGATLSHLASWRAEVILRAGVSTLDQAQQIVAANKPYPQIKVLWLVETANDALVKDLSTFINHGDAAAQTVGIELGNELDLAGLSAAQFGDFVSRNYTVLRQAGFTGDIVSGGIFSVQPESLAYLKTASQNWPHDIVLGLHRYGNPDGPQDGYMTRAAESAAIGQAVGLHPYAYTEYGYVTRTPDQEQWAVNAVATDLKWFAGANYATIYQITDGPGTDDLAHYGVKAIDNRWKPVESNFKGAGGGGGPPPQPQPPPGNTLAFDLVACRTPFQNNYCDGPAGATFAVEVATNVWKTFNGDGNGYVWASGIPNVPDSHLIIKAPNYEDLSIHISPPVLAATNAKGIHNAWELTPAHLDPAIYSLNDLAAIRGGMWPKVQAIGDCGPVPLGPRPNQPDNIVATDFISEYTPSLQDCIRKGLKTVSGYTHVALGPLVDNDGYHGLYSPNDWRGANFDHFLDIVQSFWDAGEKPVVFLHPDGWTFEQTRDELTPLLQQPRAQKLLRIVVPTGWEPTRYGWSSCTWAAFASWARQTLPNALVLIHTVNDVDAPVGTDERCDDNGHPNAEGWARVTPYIHGWLVQNNAFECPTCIDPNGNGKTNFQNWQDQFNVSIRGSLMDRFHNGYAGWPRNSAWGDGIPIRVYAGEYSAYWRFWQNRPENEGIQWGDAAMAAGADGYLDNGSVAVTVH